MIMKQILCTLLVAFFALIAQAQVTVNDEGDCYVGDGTCFFGFEGSELSQWSSVNPERLNIEGGVSIAFYKSDFIIGDYSMIHFLLPLPSVGPKRWRHLSFMLRKAVPFIAGTPLYNFPTVR